MQIREAMDRNQGLTKGLAGGAVLIGVLLILWQVKPSSGNVAKADQAFFTVDDGKTWFADDATKVPPFDHEGKAAVRCNVYNIGGKDTATFLLKYPQDIQKAIVKEREELKAHQPPNAEPVIPNGARYASSILVKKPGEGDWISTSDAKGHAMMLPPTDGIPVSPD